MAVIDGFQEQLTTSSNRPKSVTGLTHSDKEIPHSDKEAPHSDKEAPHSDKEAPHSDKEAPHSDKEAPHSDKEAPHSDKEASHSDKEVPHSDRELPKVHLGSKVAQPQSHPDQAESDIEQQSAYFKNELSFHYQIRQKAEDEAMKQFKSVLGGRCEFLVTGGAPTGKAVKKFLRDTFDVYLSDGYGTTEVSSC